MGEQQKECDEKVKVGKPEVEEGEVTPEEKVETTSAQKGNSGSRKDQPRHPKAAKGL
jgi:hypothetical protein